MNKGKGSIPTDGLGISGNTGYKSPLDKNEQVWETVDEQSQQQSSGGACESFGQPCDSRFRWARIRNFGKSLASPYIPIVACGIGGLVLLRMEPQENVMSTGEMVFDAFCFILSIAAVAFTRYVKRHQEH